MATKEEFLTELIETKYSIENNNFNSDRVKELFRNVNLIMSGKNLNNVKAKSNIIKSFMTTFNVSNFADLTALMITSSENVSIAEYTGSEFLLKELKSLLDTQKTFYKDIDSIKVKGDSFRILFESMENAGEIYTIITFTESIFFKPGKFHMFCDILMDIIRSNNMLESSVYNDLFEDTAIGINSYIETNNMSDLELYVFKFENIDDFFVKMGLGIIIELSEMIKKRLSEVFSDRSSIFRFSFSEYIVISSGSSVIGKKPSYLNDSGILDFNFKGIVLKHRCIKIPYNSNQSIYDIFENIYLLNNTVK